MNDRTKPNITVFHCVNSFTETPTLFDSCQAKTVRMACSSMTKDIQLLKAFEAGADAVLVLVCPEEGCRFAEGSKRAKKRVDYVKHILDDIGLNGDRLNLFNTKAKDSDALHTIINDTVATVKNLGPNPAV